MTFLSGTNVLNLGGTITGNLAIQAAGSTLQINAATGGSTLANIITGAGGIIQNSTNTLTLTGANTYTGGTAINAGTLSAGVAANLGAGGITFGGAGAGAPTLATTGTFALGQTITLNAAGTINIAANTTLTADQAIAGAGSLTTQGSGTFAVTGGATVGGFTNGAGVTLRTATGAGGTITTPTFANNGTVATALTVSGSGATPTFVNSGTLNVGATITAAAGAASLTVTNQTGGTGNGAVASTSNGYTLGVTDAATTLTFNQTGGTIGTAATPIGGIGVSATGRDGVVTINQSGGLIQSTGNGIDAAVTGVGAIVVNQSGGQIGSSATTRVGGVGINAVRATAGDVTVTANTIFSTGNGVNAQITGNVAGNIQVTGALAGGSINATATGINASTQGSGNVTVGTNAAPVAMGNITAGGIGINASATSGAVSVATGTGTIQAGQQGILAQTTAGGTVTVTTAAGGTIQSGANFSPIRASGTGGLVTVTNAAALQAAADGTGRGINASNSGTGGITITNTGAISGTAGTGAFFNGITAQSTGTAGNVTVTTSGAGTIGAGVVPTNAGIYGSASGSGSVQLTADASVQGAVYGVQAPNTGTGSLTVGGSGGITGGTTGILAYQQNAAAGTNADVIVSGTGRSTSTNGIAIDARITSANNAGNISVTRSGQVTAGTTGINAVTAGTGTVTVSAGPITTTNGAGIVATSATGAVAVTANGAVVAGGAGNSGIFMSGTGTANTVAVTQGVTVQGITGLRFDGGAGGTGVATLTNDGTIASNVAGGNAIQIDRGTLVIGNPIGNNAGTITGNIAVMATNSTLTVNRSQDLALANTITGAGSVVKQGTSMLTLSGASTYTGPTAVNAGALNIIGSLASAVTVNNGGLLAGTAGTAAGSGTIGGLNVANGGIVFPSAVTGTPGTLNVAGNVVFGTGSTYRVNLTPTTSDRITATGTATINGGAVQVLAGSGTYSAQQRYTLLSAGGGVTGQFTNLQTTSNLAFLTPSLSYDARNVFLGFAQTAAITTVASTPNQTGPAAALNGVGPSVTTQVTTTTNPQTGETTTQTQTVVTNVTPAAQVAAAVLNQTAPGAVQALNSLSGEVQASAVGAMTQTAFLVQEAILDHLRFGEGNGFAGGLGGPGLTGAIGQRFAPGTTLPAAYAADLPGGPVIGLVPVRPVQPNYALWGQGFGSFGSTTTNGNAARLTRQTGGFVLGIETGFGALSNALISDLRVGVAAGYSFTSLDVTTRQSTGSVESGFGAVYARGSLGPVQMRVGAAYAGNALDTRRAVLFPGFSQSVSGKAGGETVQGFGEVGYRIGLAQGYIEPFVGGAAIHIRRDAFNEVGGASALTVYGRTYDVETATAGLQGQAVLSDLLGTGMPIIARGLIGYRRAFGDVVPQALLAFGGGGQAFLTSGVPIARDAVVASAGLDVQVARHVTVGLNYTGQVGDRAQDHAVKGSFSYRW